MFEPTTFEQNQTKPGSHRHRHDRDHKEPDQLGGFAATLDEAAKQSTAEAQSDANVQVLPGHETLADMIAEAKKVNDVVARSNLGQRFAKSIKMNPEQAVKYATAGGNAKRKKGTLTKAKKDITSWRK